MAENLRLIVSCEHGGNRVPPAYAPLFAGQEALLSGHRGWDIGILPLARRLARQFGADLHAATVTRLLVDLNRSPHSRTLLSPLSRALPAEERQALLRRHYYPYRQKLETAVAALAGEGPVLHLSVHSFTPSLNGKSRNAGIGLLYDPARPLERALARRWQLAIAGLEPALRVRRNSPYRGDSDSLTRFLRLRFPPEAYLGIELEINQALPQGDSRRWHRAQKALLGSLPPLLSRRFG